MRVLRVTGWLVLMLIVCAARAAYAECGRLPSCSLLKDHDVVFTGTVLELESFQARFRIITKMKGVKGNTVTVEWMPTEEGSPGFVVGEQYLVFASRSTLDDGNHIVMSPGCGENPRLSGARPLLEQLRRERARRPATVYGQLYRSESVPSANISGVVVRLQSDSTTIKTTTDKDGSLWFDRVPPGIYHVAADIPATLQISPLNPFPSLNIGSGDCYEEDFVLGPAAIEVLRHASRTWTIEDRLPDRQGESLALHNREPADTCTHADHEPFGTALQTARRNLPTRHARVGAAVDPSASRARERTVARR